MAVTPFELTEAFTMENFNLRIQQMNDSVDDAVEKGEKVRGFVVQAVAPTDTTLLWIDTSIDGAPVLRYYNSAASTWLGTVAVWG